MQSKLSWPQARALARRGSRVRRAAWDDRYVFRTDGGLFWLADYDETFQRVIRATDFAREEFLALDWTDADPDQNHCVGIEFGNFQSGIVLGSDTPAATSEVNLGSATAAAEGDYGFTVFKNPLPVAAIASVRGSVDNWYVLNGVPEAGWTGWGKPAPYSNHFFAFDINVPSGGQFTLAARNAIADSSGWNPWYLGATVTWTARVVLDPQYFERTIDNPFVAPVTVVLTGSVTGQLLLNGIPVRESGTIDPVSFQLPAGGSFTISVRPTRRDFPFFIGYDIDASFTV